MKKSKYILISVCSISGALIIAFVVNILFFYGHELKNRNEIQVLGEE